MDRQENPHQSSTPFLGADNNPSFRCEEEVATNAGALFLEEGPSACSPLQTHQGNLECAGKYGGWS